MQLALLRAIRCLPRMRHYSVNLREGAFISSPSNARLKLLRKLHMRKHRERHGLMLLEGYRLVIDALEAGLVPDFILLAEDALNGGVESSRLRSLLLDIPAESIAYAPASIVAQLSGTETPQGVLAMLPQPKISLPVAPSLVLVCDRMSDPGNLGTLLRSAAGAGASGVLLMSGCCDPWGLKALRAGMGAQIRLPVQNACSWEEAAQLLYGWGCRVYGAAANAEIAYWDIDWSAPSALVVGSEAHGISADWLADPRMKLCHIPMSASLESLNAGVAGSIVLYEAHRQRSRVHNK